MIQGTLFDLSGRIELTGGEACGSVKWSSRTRNVTLATALLCASSASQAAETAGAPPQQQPTGIMARLPDGGSVDLYVPLFKSRIVSVPGGAHRVSVGSPDIADIVVISPTEARITVRAPLSIAEPPGCRMRGDVLSCADGIAGKETVRRLGLIWVNE